MGLLAKAIPAAGHLTHGLKAMAIDIHRWKLRLKAMQFIDRRGCLKAVAIDWISSVY